MRPPCTDLSLVCKDCTEIRLNVGYLSFCSPHLFTAPDPFVLIKCAPGQRLRGLVANIHILYLDRWTSGICVRSCPSTRVTKVECGGRWWCRFVWATHFVFMPSSTKILPTLAWIGHQYLRSMNRIIVTNLARLHSRHSTNNLPYVSIGNCFLYA
jgi:hypothetical protein